MVTAAFKRMTYHYTFSMCWRPSTSPYSISTGLYTLYSTGSAEGNLCRDNSALRFYSFWVLGPITLKIRGLCCSCTHFLTAEELAFLAWASTRRRLRNVSRCSSHWVRVWMKRDWTMAYCGPSSYTYKQRGGCLKHKYLSWENNNTHCGQGQLVMKCIVWK